MKFDLTGPISFDASDPEIQWILGLMVFTTGPIAHRLRVLGYTIKRRAEEEQVAVLIWLIRAYQHYGKVGVDWREQVNIYLKGPAPAEVKPT